MAITPLPTPPTRSDVANFAARGDQFMGAWPTLVTQINETAAAMEMALQTSMLGVTATSSTSIAIGTGSKTLTVETNKGFVVGMYLLAASTSDPTYYIKGLVTEYVSETGALTLAVDTTSGDGTIASWSISITALPSTVPAKANYSARTSNIMIGAGDIGSLIDITSGTFIQTFDTAANLGDGWWCYLRNSGSGDISLLNNVSTFVPNGMFSIDGYWTKETAWSISGKAYRSTNTSTTSIYQTITLESGVNYTLTADVVQTSGTGSLEIKIVGATTQTLGVVTNPGSVSYTFTADQASNTIYFTSQASSNWIGNIDNVRIVVTPTAQTIDSLSGFILYPGEVRLIISDGSSLSSLMIKGGRKIFLTAGEFIVPPGVFDADVFLLSGGGGGGGGGASSWPWNSYPNYGSGSGPGGGGGCGFGIMTKYVFDTAGQAIEATPGAGGSGGTSATATYSDTYGGTGGAGGNTIFGTILVYGGSGGSVGPGSTKSTSVYITPGGGGAGGYIAGAANLAGIVNSAGVAGYQMQPLAYPYLYPAGQSSSATTVASPTTIWSSIGSSNGGSVEGANYTGSAWAVGGVNGTKTSACTKAYNYLSSSIAGLSISRDGGTSTGYPAGWFNSSGTLKTTGTQNTAGTAGANATGYGSGGNGGSPSCYNTGAQAVSGAGGNGSPGFIVVMWGA